MKHALALPNGGVDPKTMGEFGVIVEIAGRDESCFYKRRTHNLMSAQAFANQKNLDEAPNGNHR